MLSREEKIPKGMELAFTILFGLTYFLDLYVYIGYKAILVPEVYKTQTTHAEILGMGLLAALLVIAFLYSRIHIRISARRLFWLGLVGQLICAWLTPWLAAGSHGFLIIRFLGAIVVNLNFCIYLMIVGRNIGRKKRTAIMSIIFFIGFLGPFLTNLIQYIAPEYREILLMLVPCIIASYAFYVFEKYKQKNDIFENQETDEQSDQIELGNDIREVLKKGNFWRMLYMLFICGLFVQFSVRFLLEPSDIFFKDGAINKTVVYMQRYLGCSFGVILFSFVSIYLSKTYWRFKGYQIRIGERKVMYLFSILFAFVALLIFQYYDILKINHPFFANTAPFIVGISNAMWCIIFLQGLETFGRKMQPIMVFLLPILLRVFWDLLSQKELTDLVGSDKIASVTIGVGFFILGIGVLTSLLWEDNFEGGNNLRAYDDNFSKDFATGIMNKEIRDEIVKIPMNTIRSENVKPYIEAISTIVKKRLVDVFDTNLYYFSFTFQQDYQYVITDVCVNTNSLRDLTKVTEKTIGSFFKYLQAVLNDNQYKGFTSYGFDNGLEGMVLAGDLKFVRPSMRQDYEDNNYKVFDLAKIGLPQDDEMINRFWDNLHNTEDFDKKGNMKKLEDFFDPIYQYAFTHYDRKAIPREIRRILTIRKLGSWLYPKGEYYIYILTPQAGVKHKLNTSILLATSSPIPAEKLSEIRDMLNYIMLEKAFAMSLDAEWKNIADQQSHALKTTFGYLYNRITAIREVRLETDEIFEGHMTEVERAIKNIDEINAFNQKMIRYETNPENLNIIIDDNGVSLNDTIKEVIKEIYYGIRRLRMTDDKHPITLKLLLKEMTIQEVFVDKEIHLKVVPIALRILLLEILKNAFTFTDFNTPKVSFQWIKNADSYQLAITNNKKMKKESELYINNNENFTEIKKIGITSMKRILRFKQFNKAQYEGQENGKWKMHVETKSDPKQTTFYLTIPKTDVKKCIKY